MYKHFEICDGINCLHCNECSNRYEILEDIWLDNNVCLRKGKFIHGHVSPMWLETNLIKRVFTPNVSQSVKEIANSSETVETNTTENSSDGLDCVLGIIDSLNTVESSIKVKPLQSDIKTEIKSNTETKTDKVVKALKEIKTSKRTKTTKTRRQKTSKI